MENVWLIFLVISVITFLIYVIIDNFRVKVVEQKIEIENLPKEFNGYKILQMSDLHSKNFGKTLYNKINNIDYDAIVFTGDIINNNDYESKSLLNIMKNINKKDNVLYVDGNNGPRTYDLRKGIITEYGKKLEDLGITILTEIYTVTKR